MKTHTQDFKDKIKELGRQLDSIISYTQDNEEVELGNEELNSITPHYQGTLLKSMMKELEIDSNVDIPLETEINYQLGLKIDDEYEYLDFGNYIVFSSEKQEDTHSYRIKAYDKMLYSMKKYSRLTEYILTEDTTYQEAKKYYKLINGEYTLFTNYNVGDAIPSNTIYENVDVPFPLTIREYITKICEQIGLTFKNASDEFVNYDKTLANDPYIDENGSPLDYTYRDVFDELSGVTASCICLDDNDEVEVRYIPEETQATTTNENVTTNSLPSEYQEVEYIEGTGTQYINTGFNPSNTTMDLIVENEFWVNSGFTGDNCVLGVRSTSTQGYGYKLPNCYGTIYEIQDYNGSPSGVLNATLQTDVKTKFRAEIQQNLRKYYLNDALDRSTTGSIRCLTNGNFYLFALNNTAYSNRADWKFNGRIYYCKIWEFGVLVRHFVPCYRKSDNVIGMYDKVNDVFYTNAGTGTFVKGPNIDPPVPPVVIDTIDEEYLKDINVNFGEKFGPINSLVLSRSADSDSIARTDEASVELNGLCDIKISDNQILNGNDRDTYIDDIFDKIKGTEYYINDFSSTGICYYDFLDKYNVEIGDNTYSCLMLNDEINVTQGLEEQIHADRIEESGIDYTKVSKTDRAINQTYLIVDKQAQEINAVVGNVTNLQNLVNAQGEQIDLLGTQITQTMDKVEISVSSLATIQDTLANGVNLVRTTSVLINNDGLSVATDSSKISTTMSNNSFTINGQQGEIAKFGYDEELETSVSRVDNLSVTKYFISGYHRTEGVEIDGEYRTCDFYIGG